MDGAQALPWGWDEDDHDPGITMSMVVTGSCTGTLDLAVDGATPGAIVDLHQGRFTANAHTGFSSPHPCAGTEGLSLLFPIVSLGSAVADGSGHAVLTGVPTTIDTCTHRVQAIDLSTCGKSLDHTTPP